MSGEKPSDPYLAHRRAQESAMADEEALFEVWFQLLRQKTWKTHRPDRAGEPVSEAYMMGLRSGYHEGWMARATIHITPVRDFKTGLAVDGGSEHG